MMQILKNVKLQDMYLYKHFLIQIKQAIYKTNITYHWRRNKANKKIEFDANNAELINKNIVYSNVIPKIDSFNFSRLNKDKIWWLNKDDKFMKELDERYKRYIKKNYIN